MPTVYTPYGLHANPLKPERCQASVHEPGRGIFIHQCLRKPWRDGWCRQHHPDTELSRAKASEARYQSELARRRALYRDPPNPIESEYVAAAVALAVVAAEDFDPVADDSDLNERLIAAVNRFNKARSSRPQGGKS